MHARAPFLLWNLLLLLLLLLRDTSSVLAYE
jgi:hypothetical protein